MSDMALRPTVPIPAARPGAYVCVRELPVRRRLSSRAPSSSRDTQPESLAARRRVAERARGGEAAARPELTERRASDSLPPQAVPKLVVQWTALVGRDLSRQAIHVLSLIDGTVTVQGILDSSAIPRPAAHDALAGLVRAKIVGF
jgi:hypothetical protein